MENKLTLEQEADCKARMETVQKFMADNQIEIISFPRFFHLSNGVYGIESMCQLMDVKYQKKPDLSVPSPFLK